MTSRDWSEYEAADSLGMIPDWREMRDYLFVLAGGNPEQLGEKNTQDMAALYQKRKSLYGRRRH